jgi:hypothetical protein
MLPYASLEIYHGKCHFWSLLNRLNFSFFRRFLNDLNFPASFSCPSKPATHLAIDVQLRRRFHFGFVSIKFVFAVTMKLQEACADWLLEEAA